MKTNNVFVYFAYDLSKTVCILFCQFFNGNILKYSQETGAYETKCNVKVDEFGFFIYWKGEAKVRKIKILHFCIVSVNSALIIILTSIFTGVRLPGFGSDMVLMMQSVLLK